jgi:hypothetical protein
MLGELLLQGTLDLRTAVAGTRGWQVLRGKVGILWHMQWSAGWHMSRPTIELRHTGGWVGHLREVALSHLCLQELRGHRREPVRKRLKVLRLKGVLGLHHGSHEGLYGRCRGVITMTHLCLHLLQAHHFPTGSSRLGLLLRNTPDTGLCLQIRDISGVRVLLIAGALGLRGDGLDGKLSHRLSDSGSIGILQAVSNLLLANCVRHQGSLPKEIEVSSG